LKQRKGDIKRKPSFFANLGNYHPITNVNLFLGIVFFRKATYFVPGLVTQWAPDHLRFRVVFQAVIAYLTSDIQRQTEHDMGPDWLFLETFSYQVAKKLQIQAHDFGKSHKMPLFP
jgi:hypothetical protein